MNPAATVLKVLADGARAVERANGVAAQQSVDWRPACRSSVGHWASQRT